jgi:hypothetical protein
VKDIYGGLKGYNILLYLGGYGGIHRLLDKKGGCNYIRSMTITQTVEITDDRRITVPREVPTGATIITFTPAPSAAKQMRGERDKEIYARYADELNKEAMDVLSYQNYFLDAEDSQT